MHECIRLEVDTSSVWQRLALSLIEFIYLFIYLLQFMAHKQRKPMDVMQKSQGPHIRA